ncbi:CRISPR-associated protein Csx3, partial [Scytonema sp. PCC 10023]|uniref:CRISPR-associated protein Csx3 n=1 Tax=Scytonema sp. PCC 10023 TaxID=1680591 RepID=UPI0039C6DE34
MIDIEVEQVSDEAALIELDDEIEPSDLAYLQFPVIDGANGLVIGGFDAWVIAAIAQGALAEPIATEYQGKVSWVGVLNPSLHNPDDCLIIWSQDENFK